MLYFDTFEELIKLGQDKIIFDFSWEEIGPLQQLILAGHIKEKEKKKLRYENKEAFSPLLIWH